MPDIQNHDRADILMDDYVMGTLSDTDLAWMDAHLAGCSVCQREIPALLEGTFALGWSAEDPPVEMADDLWHRIEANLTLAPPVVEPRDFATTWGKPQAADLQPIIPLDLGTLPQGEASRPRGGRITSLWGQPQYRWLAAAALVLIVVGVAAIVGRSLWSSNDPEPAQEIALHDADGNIIASSVANFEYLPDERQFVLHMDDMPEAPEGQIYQAWLIAGDVPTPVGIVDPATGEFMVEGDRAAFDAFAITVEPGPDQSDLPTTNPIVVAPLNATG